MADTRPNVPAWWLSRLADLERLGGSLRTGGCEAIARSAGGRSVWAWRFGPEPPRDRTTNFPAATGAGDVAAYRGAAARPASLMLIAGTHGAETEGIVGAANLASLLATGRDLTGQARPELQTAAEGVRLIVLPCANPDGRARVEPDSLAGMTLDDLRYWGQGRWKDGQDVDWPACKRHQPLPPDAVTFLGGYPNDDGYNLMYETVPADLHTAEAAAVYRLAADEAPDVILHLHSCQYGPGIVAPKAWLPPTYQQAVADFARRAHQAFAAAELRPNDYGQTPSPVLDWSVGLTHACGALPLTFEGPHGLAERPYSHREILEIHLTLFTEALALARRVHHAPPWAAM